MTSTFNSQGFIRQLRQEIPEWQSRVERVVPKYQQQRENLRNRLMGVLDLVTDNVLSDAENSEQALKKLRIMSEDERLKLAFDLEDRVKLIEGTFPTPKDAEEFGDEKVLDPQIRKAEKHLSDLRSREMQVTEWKVCYSLFEDAFAKEIKGIREEVEELESCGSKTWNGSFTSFCQQRKKSRFWGWFDIAPKNLEFLLKSILSEIKEKGLSECALHGENIRKKVDLSLKSENIGILLDDFFDAEKAKATIDSEIALARRDLDALLERRKQNKAWMLLQEESGKMVLIRAVVKDWILKEFANRDYLVSAGIADKVTTDRIWQLKNAWNLANTAYQACFQDMTLLANMYDSLLFDSDLEESIQKYYQSEPSSRTLERLVRDCPDENAPWFDAKKISRLRARIEWYYRNPNVFTMPSIEKGIKENHLYDLKYLLEGQHRILSVWDAPDEWQAFRDTVYDWEKATKFFDPESVSGTCYRHHLIHVDFFAVSKEAKELENNVIMSKREAVEEV